MTLETTSLENSRRDFLKTAGSALAGIMIVGFVPSVFVGCSSDSDTGTTPNPPGTKITVNVSTLTSDNQAVRTSAPNNDPLIIIRRSSTTYVTLLLVCTHQGCRGTSIENSTTKLHCTCHGSEYDLDGHVIHGPAPANLTSYPTVYDSTKNEVTVTLA